MSLRDWIANLSAHTLATVATTATDEGTQGVLSQESQLSQGVADGKVGREGARRSQLSQLSQPITVSATRVRGGDRGAAQPIVRCSTCRYWAAGASGGGGIGTCATGADERSRSAHDRRPLSAWPDAPRHCAGWESQNAAEERAAEESARPCHAQFHQ